MAQRASWKGYLKLSLVSCAVALYPAGSSSGRVSFNTLNRETGNRLRQQMIDSETGDVVDREDRVRGFEVSKGHYVQVEDEEIEALQIESNHTIDIERFVPREEVDIVYLDGSHYMAPEGKVAEEAFAVIREAMEKEGVVGIGRVVLSRRERLVVLEPRGRGILATSLRSAKEVRGDEAYFADIGEVEVSEDMLDLATHIIGRKKGHFDTSKFEDRYEDALIEMLAAKGEGRAMKMKAPEKGSNVVNLMDALRRSIESDRGGEKSAPPRGKSKAKTTKSASASTETRSRPKSTGTRTSRKPARRAAG
jgi:DNA end-binding protein Ku